eukprot:UN23980
MLSSGVRFLQFPSTRRFCAAAAATTAPKKNVLKVGDRVTYTDFGVNHNFVFREQEAANGSFLQQRVKKPFNVFERVEGVIVKIPKNPPGTIDVDWGLTSKVVINTESGKFFLNGVKNVKVGTVKKYTATRLTELKFKDYAGEAFDISKIKGKVSLVCSLTQNESIASDSQWRQFRKMLKNLAPRGLIVLCYPTFQFDVPADKVNEWVRTKFGVNNGEGVYMLQKADINGPNPQGTFQIIKQ